MPKRILLWDWSCTKWFPEQFEQVPQGEQIIAVANWNAWHPTEAKGRLPFIPQVRTPAQAYGDEWSWIWDSNAQTVMFLNEPERQSVSVEDAVRMWRSQMLRLRQQRNAKLIGPSPANDPKGNGWLERFMQQVGSDKPDFIGVHVYETDVGNAKRYLESVWNKYHIPLVVTEIACIDRNYGNVLRWTAAMTQWMDCTDWIHSYAVYGCLPQHSADDYASAAAQLMNSDGSFRDLMYKLMYDDPMNSGDIEVAKGEGSGAYH
jgi:Glycosyl hydrolase catalytic core